MTAASDTADRILDVAERLVQVRGFNGFSFTDLAAAVRIRKPSVHHHFATKAVLGERLIDRYTERFDVVLEAIERDEPRAARRLARYAAIFAEVLRDEGRFCMCGMLAAELATLPDGMRASVRTFFTHNETWLARVLELGRKQHELAFKGPPRQLAARLLSGLEGAMLVARAFGDPTRFESQARALLATLQPSA